MQFRRRWRAKAFLASVVMCGAVAVAAPLPPGLPDPAAEAARFKTDYDAGREDVAVADRSALVDACLHISDPVVRDDYGGKIAAAWEPLAGDKKAGIQLNAAICIGQLHTFSSAGALTGMLKHSNPAVRYWAARGLGDIPNLKRFAGPTLTNALNALGAAMAKETTGIVKKEIMRSLGVLGDAGAILDGLDALGGTILGSVPDQPTLETASLGLADLDASLKATPPAAAMKTNIAKVVSFLASFVSQQEVSLQLARQTNDGSLPPGYHTNAAAVVSNAIKVLNTLAGKIAFTVDTSSPDKMKFDLDRLFGTPDVGPGQLQKEFPGVPVPPTIKPPKPAPPATATATSRPGGA